MASLGKAILELFVDSSKLEAGMEKAKRGVSGIFASLKSMTGTFAISIGTMVGNLMTGIVQSIGQTIINIARNSVQGFLDYADQVRNVSRSLGASAEESSRLIQIADDVGISYDSLATSMKLAMRDGIEPNIDGLARLADQYQSLAPGVERTQFLLDKFGRSGEEMGKLLEKGSDGIYAMSEAIDESMILTQEAIDTAENYRIGVDSLKDSWDGLTYQAAPPLIDALNAIVNHYRDITTSLKENGYWYTVFHQLSLDDIAAKRELSDATLRVMRSNEEATGSFGDMAGAEKVAEQASKDLEAALKEQFEANKKNIDFTLQVADFQRSYERQHKEAVEAVTKAQLKLNEAKAAEYDDDEARNKAIDGATEGLHEANTAMGELEASWHEKTQRMIYDMVLTKLSADGLTEAELKAAEQVAVQMGIMTGAQAEQAAQMRENANSILDGILKQEDVVKEQAAIDKQRADAQAAIEAEKQQNIGNTTQAIEATTQAADGTTQAVQETTDTAGLTTQAVQTTTEAVNATTAAINEEVNRQIAFTEQIWKSVEAQNALNASAGGGSVPSSDASIPTQDAGGYGKAGKAYMIGTGAQPEVFIPGADGMFFPRMQHVFKQLGELGGVNFMSGFQNHLGDSMRHVQRGRENQTMNRATTFNTNVYNPTPEPASKSLDRTLRKLSWGVD